MIFLPETNERVGGSLIMDDIFISYSHEDHLTAKKLVKLLSETYDNVWYDGRIAPGEDWEQEIMYRVRTCDHFVFLISKDSLASPWCLREYEEAERHHRHIIPILVRGAPINEHAVSHWQILNMSDGVTAQNLNKLYRALIRRLKSEYQQRELFHKLKTDLENLMQMVDSESLTNASLPSEALSEPFADLQPESPPEPQPKSQPAKPVPPTQQPNGSSVTLLERDISLQIRQLLPSFVDALKEWDDEPWNVITRFTGHKRALLSQLDQNQQRQLYESMRNLLHAAHNMSMEYENIMRLIREWSLDINMPPGPHDDGDDLGTSNDRRNGRH
jgi:hypothetical protein